MKQAAALALLAALALVPRAQAGSRSAVLAVLSTGVTAELVRVDPATLRIEGTRVSLWRTCLAVGAAHLLLLTTRGTVSAGPEGCAPGRTAPRGGAGSGPPRSGGG